MPAICLVDTSIFVEILQVPGMTGTGSTTRSQMREKINAGEIFILPWATILETGAHIAQNGDGTQRRSCARRFVEQVSLALEGKSPFGLVESPSLEQLGGWLADFPDHAGGGRSLADISIIQHWHRQCAGNSTHRVYIWGLDAHLATYDRPATLAR